MEIKNYFAQDAQGNIMPSANCYLYLPGTTTLATGLVDGNGTPISNPFLASNIGQVTFGAPNGVYDLRISQGARDTTIEIQCTDLLQALNETASFLGAKSSAPTTRNDGSALNIADRYFNTIDQLEYLYKSTGWVVNNLDGQLIATTQGASLIGALMQDGSAGTVQQAINIGDNSLRQDLADDTDPAKGLGMTGRMRWDGLWSSLADGKLTGQSILDSITYNLWESAHLVTVRPDPANPSTWIWTPAVQDAMDTAAALKKRLYVPPGDYNINASLVAPADLITNIYSDNLYYTGAAIGSVAAAPVRFICDIPSGPLFTSPGRVRVRINIQGIAAVNVSTVNPDCRFIECEVFGSTITENFAHSFHGFAKGNVGFISSIRRNVSMNTRLTALEGSYVDAYVEENYLSMSVDTVDVETAIFRGSMGLTSFVRNFSEFSVRGIVSTSLTNQTIRGNTWDYIAKPLDISGVSGGSIGDNKFTHCSKVFAGRLNLSPSNPLRTADWVSMNFGSTIRGLSVFGNVGSRVDILGSFKSNNYFNIVTTGNVVEPVTDVASSNILWDVATASIDNLTLTENNDRIYATSPNMSGVSEGQRFGVGNLRYLKLGGQAKLTTCSASKVLATVTTSELLDMSALPLRVPLRLHVVVGSGFSTYSYKIYDIYRDSGLQVFTITANEANAPVASSTVTVSGNNISINAVGSAASKTMAYNFLIL